MAGFAKRPHRKTGTAHHEKKYEMPVEKEAGGDSYITASFFDDDSDDDDIPDTRRRQTGKKKIVYNDDGETKAKKPNFFVRAAHAIFPTQDAAGPTRRR